MAIIWNTFVVYQNLVPKVKKQIIFTGHRNINQERQPKLFSQTDKVQNIRGRMENTYQTVVAGEASESDEDDAPSQTSKVLKIQNYFILAF